MKKLSSFLLVILVLGGIFFVQRQKTDQSQDSLLDSGITAFEDGDLAVAADHFAAFAAETGDEAAENTSLFLRQVLTDWLSEEENRMLAAYEACLGMSNQFVSSLSDELLTYYEDILEMGPALRADANRNTEDEILARIATEPPFVGMDAKYIDSTILGKHDKTGHNTQKYANEPPAKKHDCTLYYWMDGSRCIYIARVQDDIGEVITVSENPSGSYFGN